MMCVALNVLVSAIDPAVRFDITRESTVHMEDTTPLAIGTAGVAEHDCCANAKPLADRFRRLPDEA